MDPNLRIDIRAATGSRWANWVTTSLILSIFVTVILRVPVAQKIIALFGPDAERVASQAVGWAWGFTALLAFPLVLWATKRLWGPLLLYALIWLLRQIGRGFVALWHVLIRRRPATQPTPVATPVAQAPSPASVVTSRPPLDLIGPPARVEVTPCPEVAQQVIKGLASLGITNCRLVDHYRGPVLSVVQIRPPETTKASTVQKVASDLSALLGTRNATIEPVVGAPGVLEISVANPETESVPLRALLDSAEYRSIKHLPLVIGLAATGVPLVVDLATLPHLLVAGTTGSGKSVAINQMLLGLLIRLGPDELRLVLIDPKKVEFGIYKGLPHLLRPVITEPEVAIGALGQLVAEMERRYSLMEEAGYRNILDYHRANPKGRLPLIVAVVDELADLKEALRDQWDDLESHIVRIAQKARAAGIHLVVATQSPRADVITGLIKANIPGKVALTVSNQVESRVVLDFSGAEQLRGRGDLLFKLGGETTRGQGAWVPDEMVRAVVGWWQRPGAQAPPSPAPPPPPATAHREPDPAEAPEMTREQQELVEVARMALERGQVGRRDVERALGIGSGRANTLLQMLEDKKWLTPSQGPKPRQCAFPAAQRRQMLAEVQGIRPEEVVLLDESTTSSASENAVCNDPSSPPEPAEPPVSEIAPEVEEIGRRIRGAARYGNWVAVDTFLPELDRLRSAAHDAGDRAAIEAIQAVDNWIAEHQQHASH